MIDAPRKNASSTRGRPFKVGNTGRPKGARHKTTVAVEALLAGEAEALTRRAVELALLGDPTALKLCFERVAPVRRGRPVTFAAPKIETAADVTVALGHLIKAVAAGDLTPDEGAQIAALLETSRRSVETAALEARLAALEERTAS